MEQKEVKYRFQIFCEDQLNKPLIGWESYQPFISVQAGNFIRASDFTDVATGGGVETGEEYKVLSVHHRLVKGAFGDFDLLTQIVINRSFYEN